MKKQYIVTGNLLNAHNSPFKLYVTATCELEAFNIAESELQEDVETRWYNVHNLKAITTEKHYNLLLRKSKTLLYISALILVLCIYMGGLLFL